jgi:hypothetical protein
MRRIPVDGKNAPNPDAPLPEAPRAPARRFRLEKLEERIAPKKGGRSTNNCATGTCGSDSESTGTSGY